MIHNIFEEIELQKKRNVFLVLTGPIGAGKDALFTQYLKQYPDTMRIITTTSRPMRAGESEGNPIHFVSNEKFEAMIKNNEFFDWVEFRDYYKGTPYQTLKDAINSGKDIIWHIEAQGIKQQKPKIQAMPIRSVFVFLTAPSREVLEDRVKKAEGDAAVTRWNEPLVQKSLDNYMDCEYLVVNEEGKLDEAIKKIRAILDAKRMEIEK